jgi:hypothetical protein
MTSSEKMRDMKTIIQMFIITGIMSLAAVNPAHAADQTVPVVSTAEPAAAASQSLEAGVIEEEANLNPEAALEAYQAVIQRYEAQRLEAAQAMFRAAEVLRKTGELAEASRTYQRVLREFPNQRELTAKSQRQLELIRSSMGDQFARGATRIDRTVKYPWLINVAFGSSLHKRGPAAIGNGTNDYWNGYYLPWIDVVPLINLMLWNGSITPVSMEIRNAAGTWSNQTGDPMYDAYVYVNDGSDKHILLTLTNLPPGHYDFCLYGHADPGGQGEGNSQFQISSGETTTDWVGTLNSAGWKATQPWGEGRQYVWLRKVRVMPGEPVVVRVRAGYNGESIDPQNRPPVINGMQIVKLEEAKDIRDASNFEASQFALADVPSASQPSTPPEREGFKEPGTSGTSLQQTLQESKHTLKTQLLSQLEQQLNQARDEIVQAAGQEREASRLYGQVHKFKDRPWLLPKPAADDPRYQQLRRSYDQAQLAALEHPEDGKAPLEAALKAMESFVQDIYLLELKTAAEEAAESKQQLQTIQMRLQKQLEDEHDRLTKEQSEERR